MTALTQDRNTPERTGRTLSLPLAAGVIAYAGGLACITPAGTATPGASVSTLKGVGRFEEAVDNSDGAAGDLNATVRRGVFRFENDGDDPVDLGDLGTDCYVVDDQTVAATDGEGSRGVAGKVSDIDDLGVWVKFD